ncbi:folliculin-interacting protein N-terminus-domain-containing protein [Aspergillus carlsbadensis]|nr:folliculin-interacting protein N-terminus-domain-containing protein [Aspergillus carlsbadensis]
MLGRLLNTAATTLNPSAYSNKPTTQLDSVTEEEHTSGLLFPDVNQLRRSNAHNFPLQTAFSSPNASAAGAYDDRGGVELDPLKDFRVIIAQNSLGDREPCILLDTRADTSEPTSPGLGMEPQVMKNAGPRHHARTVSTVSSLSRGRRGLVSQSSMIDQSPLSLAAEARRTSPVTSSAFTRARGRSSTLAQAGGGLQEPAHLRHSPSDMNDAGLLNCIFGSSAFSYRGSSTKMHIISADDESGATAGASPAARNSFIRSYTTGSPSGFASNNGRADYKPRSKVTILLTRMFSVNLPEAGETSSEGQDLAASLHQESLPEIGFPFPDVSKRKKVKEKKTPMYAVAIAIQIPVLSRNAARPGSRFSTPGQDSPRPGMACSLDSDYRWRGGFLDDTLASAPPSLDERIDMLVDHWDVVNRTLSHLERLSRSELLFLLKRVDSAGMHPKPVKPPNMQRTNQTFLHLPANVLAINSKLMDEAVRSARRISTALQIPNVVTGQSRWGVWREEGRSIVRSLGDKDHSFFFLVLITAFLGNHTEWLNALGPDWYRRRHYLQQKAQQDAEPALPYRTVIICPDKMTARRLIFLLSAFLPPKQRLEQPLPSPLRPGTAASTRAVSQSPPSIPVLRSEPLRKAIERRSRAQRLNMTDRDQYHRSVSASSNETAHRSTTDDAESTGPNDVSIYRRGSDARSIRTIGIPMHARDARSNNISTPTTSAANPGSAVPVPHFASQGRLEREEGSDQTLGDGADSLASETLLKNLQRSESSATSVNSSVPSSAGGRWGSLFSGLWSSRQESPDKGGAGYSTEPRHRSGSVYTMPAKRNPPTLSQMVEEVSEESPPTHIATSANISIPHSSNSLRKFEDDPQDLSSTTDNTKETLLKLSVRDDDGIVDVELPLPGFVSLSSSGDSTMASPKKTRTSVTSVDALASTHSSGSGLHHHQAKDTDGPKINVAGWLKSFHDDYLLQGVRPYSNLEADVKRAMQSEPTPNNAAALDTDGSEKWVDVATTLIADVRTFSVKRLRLRRRVTGGNSLKSPTSPPSLSNPGTPRHFSGGSISTSQISGYFSSAMSSAKSSPRIRAGGFHLGEVEEKFIEEPVMDLDGTLVDALERVLAQSGPPSLAPTRAPSPTRSRKENDRAADTMTMRDDVPTVEAPRAECRRLVLGALEEVVRSVAAEHCREDDGELNPADRERKRLLTGADNTLREGVRKWLLDVEEAW